MRLRPALSLTLAASLSLGGGATPVAFAATGGAQLEIKVGQADGLSHIEFHGAQPRAARRDGKDLVLRFARLAPLDLSRLRVDPPKWLKGAELTDVGGGSELRLKLADNAQARLGRADGAAYVNLSEAPAPPPAAAKPAPAAPAPADQPPPKRPDPAPASGVVKLRAELNGRTLMLRFPWRTPLGAAVFRRGDAIWVVFDAKAKLDLAEAPHGLPQMRKMDAVQGGDYTAVRIAAPPEVLVTASAEGPTWTVALGPNMTAPTTAVPVSRDEQDGAASLKLQVAGSTGVFWLNDPEVGDRIAAVTALPPTKGLTSRQEFVDAALLPSAQGLAVEPAADDLAVQSDGDIVRIGRPKGLALSSSKLQARKAIASTLALPQPAVMPALINFQEWSQTGGASFLARYDQLTTAAAEEAGKGKAAGYQARMGLARFLVGSELAYEAVGVLNTIARADQTMMANPEFRGLRGAARAMAGRYKDAQADFSAPAVATDPSSSLWRGYIANKLGDYTGARQQFAAGISALSAFNPKWKARFLRADAEAALAMGDQGAARGLLLMAAAEKLEPQEIAEVDLDRARLFEAGGQADQALTIYEALSRNPYGAISAPALLHATQIKLAQGKLAPPAAVATLDSLRFMWRGDGTELETVRALGRIYLGQGRYREALDAMRSASKNLPDLPGAVAMQNDLTGVFRSLFLDGLSDGLQPIQALGLFYDFKELTPIGADGDMMVRKLARRLVNVDLLDQAAELLKYQAENRLDGVPRAEVSTDLAMIDLMARRPEEALNALNSSRSTLLPSALQARRRVIEARAWTQLGQFDHALEILGTDNAPDAVDVRADVAWGKHDWAKAGAMLETALGDRWKKPDPLSPDEESKLLRAGIAYSLAPDEAGLARLRGRFGKLAQGAHAPDALRVALAGAQSGALSPADYAHAASDADAFAGWVAQMKKRYLASSAVAAAAPAPPAAKPAPAKTAQAAPTAKAPAPKRG